MAALSAIVGWAGLQPSEAATAPAQQVAIQSPGAWQWLADGPFVGPIYMVVSISRQQIHVYDGDRLIAAAAVSTGTKGHSTPTGDFPILQKRVKHRSNIYSNAPMPFMQRLTWGGIALHAGHNPGYPASHGCIRLPYAFAQKLFGLTQLGTLVTVAPDRLNATIALDPLVLNDRSATVIVGFTPRSTPFTPPPATAAQPLTISPAMKDQSEQAPRLAIDPAIFIPRLSSDRTR
ncbi:L,D-transpeptidase family protein [Sphingobium fontiphilum]|uniref:L,D-transpeptidase family protein n=1 Tax=Sphingobium fontiphilum TaxID=944425 RepID=UPI0031B628B5